MAMGQPRRAESASWWVPALFWIDERSPGMAGNLTWGSLHARILLKVVLGGLSWRRSFVRRSAGGSEKLCRASKV